ncbi:hypothetical protein [Sulfurovum sp.]|uniref:hypothetical protein n=1 Tax=Sulfurovum sp. TaxID=1969726 RepID=UPI0025F77C8D|nr:hypothetical protein [Sulfurovum sp.]
MQKVVNNLTSAPVTIGGIEVGAKTQRAVRESLITEEEKEAISKVGATLTINDSAITIGKAEEGNVSTVFSNVAYPAELIKNDGTLNGKPALKAKIEALQEEYGEAILDDASFAAKYPEANIDAHRVEVGA